MPGPDEIFANYAALEALTARLSALSASFSGVPSLDELPAAATGHPSLAHEYEAFRSKWIANRQLIDQELQAAAHVAREAIATYRHADTTLAGDAAP